MTIRARVKGNGKHCGRINPLYPKVYPEELACLCNPLKDAGKEPVSFVLCDEKGAVVRTSVLMQEETRFDRDGLSKGVYFFRLYGRQKVLQHGTVIVQ